MTHHGSPAPSPGRAGASGPARLGVVLVAGVLLGGCGDAAPAARDDGLAVAYYEPTGSGGNGALLTGVVQDRDGCLVVQQDGSDEEEPYVPVFATNDSTAREVSQGAAVELGGSWVSELGDDLNVPAACPTDGPFWMVIQPE